MSCVATRGCLVSIVRCVCVGGVSCGEGGESMSKGRSVRVGRFETERVGCSRE